MKVKALQDFNLGSLSKDYKVGDVATVSASVGKELIDAKLAEEVEGDDEAEQPEKRETKPAAAVITSKPAKGASEQK